MSNIPHARSPRRATSISPTVCGCALLISILLALALPARAAGPAFLVKNINTTIDPSLSSFPSELVAIGNTLYFGANGPQGEGLWRSDGTPAGTTLVKEVYPRDTINVNGTLFFLTPFDIDGNSSLWRSDGTPAGTTLVKSFAAFALANVNGTLFLGVNEPSVGHSLWRSDGTPAGTTLVKDLSATGIISSELVNLHGAAFFILHKDGRKQLWKSNGTPGGTVPVQIVDDRGGAEIQVSDLTVIQDTLYFVVGDSHNYTQLWKSDGNAAGTILLKEFTAGVPQEYLRLSWLTELNGKLFFAAQVPKGDSYLPSLWKSDGTVAGTVMIKNITPVEMTKVGGTLFLSTRDGPGELWKSDGTAAGTTLVKDVCEDLWPTQLTDIAGTLFFACNPAFSTNFSLWKSDGSAAGTTLVTTIADVVPPTLHPSWMTNVGGRLFFVVQDGNGAELWKSDGTAAGTGMVKDIYPPTERHSFPQDMVELADTLFFFADDGSPGLKLWRSDGTQAGTTLVKQINTLPRTLEDHEMTRAGDNLFFVADDSDGRWLWRSDGTQAGTIRLKSTHAEQLTDVGGILFFTTDNNTTLWKSDGSQAGTVIVKRFDQLAPSRISELTDMDGTLFFSIYACCVPDDPERVGLWRSDGTDAGTTRITDIRAGALTPANGMLFFAGQDARIGLELWRSDGTPGGTALVRDINPGAADSIDAFGFTYMTAVDGAVFFSADDGSHGWELWHSNGTPGGTTLVKDINPGAAPSFPSDLTGAQGTLFFTAIDGSYGRELWRSDGTPAGTLLLKDIYPGKRGGVGNNMASVNRTLFFDAYDPTNGIELWRSDGTEAGTALVQDIAPGDEHSSPSGFTVAGEHLFFDASDNVTGHELWALHGESDTYVTAPSLLGASPGGVATIPLVYGNNGIAAAGPVTLTVTLASGLTYLGDTTGISPTVSAGTLTWRLPDLARLNRKPALLRVGLPAAAYGTRYPVSLALTPAGAEPYPPDNTAQVELMVARQMYLPLTRR